MVEGGTTNYTRPAWAREVGGAQTSATCSPPSRALGLTRHDLAVLTTGVGLSGGSGRVRPRQGGMGQEEGRA